MNIDEQILQHMIDNPKQSRADFDKIFKAIADSELNYKGRCVQTLALPKLIDRDLYTYIEGFISNCFVIFNKIINRFFADAGYRNLFGFSPEMEELILLTNENSRFVPMARIDFFLNEETRELMLCEINTDGTSAMNEDRILGGLLQYNSALQSFFRDKAYTEFELFDSWITEFLTVYRRMRGTDTVPNVAIADFLDKATINEFKQFEAQFNKRNIPTEICDIREFVYKGGVLKSPSGMRIDAIYRRAVTADILAEIGSVSPFINAVKDNAVTIIGGFCTQIIHNKHLFFALHRPETHAFLTADEIAFVTAHVPRTHMLTAEIVESEQVIKTKDSWLIKPCDSYGSKGVYAGVDNSESDWISLVGENTNNDYLLQQFVRPYKTLNIDIAEEIPTIRPYSNITGIFCYNQKPYGVYSRFAKGEIISSKYDEKSAVTLLVEKK